MFLAAKMGLYLSMNPFVLSSTLVYVAILSCWRHSRAGLVYSGVIYIGMMWLIQFLVLVGNYDHLLYHPLAPDIILGFYVVLAVLWAYIGWLHWRDWRAMKSSGKQRLGLPRLIDAQLAKPRGIKLWILIFGFLFAGWLVTMFEGRLTGNYYLLVLLKATLEQEGLVRALLTFGVYEAAYTITLLVIWGIAVLSASSARIRTKLDALAVFERIGFVAFYWAVSIGLIYYLLRIVQF